MDDASSPTNESQHMTRKKAAPVAPASDAAVFPAVGARFVFADRRPYGDDQWHVVTALCHVVARDDHMTSWVCDKILDDINRPTFLGDKPALTTGGWANWAQADMIARGQVTPCAGA